MITERNWSASNPRPTWDPDLYPSALRPVNEPDLTAAEDDARQVIVMAAITEIMGASTYEAWVDASHSADLLEGRSIDDPALRAEYDYQREVAHEHADAAIWVAAPLIEAQVRERVAAEIDKVRLELGKAIPAGSAGHYAGLAHAARIARTVTP